MAMTVTSPTRPDFSAAVPARGGYRAMSITDYARVDSARSEFLNFLLATSSGSASVAADRAA